MVTSGDPFGFDFREAHRMRRSSRHVTVGIALAAVLFSSVGVAPAANASGADQFYSYTGKKPLSSYRPGAVLKTRTVPYHVAGLPAPVQAVQLLYRTSDAKGRPAANVTSVLRPVAGGDFTKAVSYQSFYDSANPADGPSRAIAGGVRLGSALFDVETTLIAPQLAQGHPVIIADTEGQRADFLAGPEYGRNTLDSVRAATRSAATGLNNSSKIGMIGYSGGSVATGWAAQLAPKYAPDVNARLVGAALGGVPVDPAHMLRYANGSALWAPVMPMALATTARAFGADYRPYLSDFGKRMFAKVQGAAMVDVIGRYPALRWQRLMKPRYRTIGSVPPMVATLNKINMGSAPTPSTPMFLGQGATGAPEGTLKSNVPGVGAGDGITVTGDVRSLARQFCATGNSEIKYTQYDLLSHNTAAPVWSTQAVQWLNDRLAGKAAPSSCGHIAPGNSLAPERTR